MTFMMSLLTERALKWAQAVLNGRPGISYVDFLSKFWSVFDKGSRKDAAAHRMFNLRQGKRSVADFSIDFWILAKETGWQENVLCSAFLNSLNKKLKHKLSAKSCLLHLTL